MAEFRRLLVPHDFSKQADGALKVAARLVARGGRLVVLHVVVPYVPVTDIPPAGIAASYVDPKELVAAASAQLERTVAKALPNKIGATVERKVELGDPHDQIIKEGRAMDVIVMATTGRTGLSHLLIGSVAEKVVRHSPVPVLTLRPEAVRRAVKLGAR
jgi:nucleotide-binding universal stress UspA family protein